MSQKQTIAPAAPVLKLADVYFILFRHKWMILILTTLSVGAASIWYAYAQMPFVSTAELYISSVSTSVNPDAAQDNTKTLDTSETVILNSEVLLLDTLDLAKKSADLVGAKEILAPYGGGTNLDEAAALIHQNFTAEALPNSQMIRLTYTHPEGKIVTEVLGDMITNYLAKHDDIHNHPHMWDDQLNQETTEREAALQDVEKKLAGIESASGVVNVDESMKVLENEKAASMQNMSAAEADLADAEAAAEEYHKMLPGTNAASNASNNIAIATNVALPDVSVIEEYRNDISKWLALRDKAEDLSYGHTTNSPAVKFMMIQVSEAEKAKKALEAANPGLLTVASVASRGPDGAAALGFDPQQGLNNELIKIERLKHRIESYSNELSVLTGNGTNLVNIQIQIKDLEREEQLKSSEYMAAAQAQAKETGVEDMIDSKQGSANISVADPPSPPSRDIKKISKMIVGIASSGLILGLGLAFLWEMVLDRTFKRPQEVITRLKLPFFLSIPYLKEKRSSHPTFKTAKNLKMLPPGTEGTPAAAAENNSIVPAGDGAIAPWDEKHALRPFHETLRDRLVSYFEMINLTHKPKLVAVTSCADGAGVSTVASGLACSLSETGEGNVLLVDMNSEEGEAHHFYKGKLAMGLDDILEKQRENRDTALVQDNLYVVKESTNGDKLPSILPKRFSHLVSKLKASDYDYIILDMPPVTEISVTPRLAKFMDMVLLVVEAGKTDRDVAQRASTLLSESRANVGVVMNKSRSYVPRRLHQEV